MNSNPRAMSFQYTQVFTKSHRGIFNAGDKLVNQISFPSLTLFTMWVQEINAAHKARKLPYYISIDC
jgi:hypothetical protein